MSRLNPVAVSLELRTLLAADAGTFTHPPVQEPTGRDTRRLADPTQLPEILVEITGTLTKPRAIGGVMETRHQLSLFYAVQYADGDDANLLALLLGTELYDWLGNHKAGATYKLFDFGGVQIEYQPVESNAFGVTASVAMVKLTCLLDEKYTHNL